MRSQNSSKINYPKHHNIEQLGVIDMMNDETFAFYLSFYLPKLLFLQIKFIIFPFEDDLEYNSLVKS